MATREYITEKDLLSWFAGIHRDEEYAKEVLADTIQFVNEYDARESESKTDALTEGYESLRSRNLRLKDCIDHFDPMIEALRERKDHYREHFKEVIEADLERWQRKGWSLEDLEDEAMEALGARGIGYFELQELQKWLCDEPPMSPGIWMRHS